jgi:hypothetical protein
MKYSYYVYYKVPVENAKRARAAVSAVQQDLLDVIGIGGRLLRRRDDETTWMEIYENVADPQRFEVELAELVERHGLAALLASGSSRKREIFRAF